MLPFNAVFGTGSGMNIVQRDALFDVWEKLLDKDATMPRLGDANGRPLRLLVEITLRISFGNTTYRVPFIVANKSRKRHAMALKALRIRLHDYV